MISSCLHIVLQSLQERGQKKIAKEAKEHKAGMGGCLAVVRFLPISPVGIGNGCSVTHAAAGGVCTSCGKPAVLRASKTGRRKRDFVSSDVSGTDAWHLCGGICCSLNRFFACLFLFPENPVY